MFGVVVAGATVAAGNRVTIWMSCRTTKAVPEVKVVAAAPGSDHKAAEPIHPFE